MRELYADVETAVVAWFLDRGICSVNYAAGKLNLRKTRQLIADVARERSMAPDHGGRLHQFKKGQVPPNKGKRGYCSPGSEKGWFKKGHQRNDTAALGAERVNRDGYVEVKVAERGRYANCWREKHRLVWEAANGPIPPKHCVIFKDSNRQNCVIDNLELITQKTNMLRNSVHNLPKPLASTIQLLGALKRSINGKQRKQQQQLDHGSEGSPVRHAQSAEGSGRADGN